MSRQPQNGVIAPLDLAIGEQRANKPTVIDSAHLSPVYEAGASSPNTVRHNDVSWLPVKPEARDEGRLAGAEIDEHTSSPTERRVAVYEDDGTHKSAKALASASKATSPRVNGHVRGAKSESDGGWQKAGKGKKKATNAAAPQGHAEQPPKHESERKGG
ncbi:PAP/25A-associated-like protein [Ophiocordyceps sinensis CO18]|nr:PAP/25A-associated-like protein [Ophiocordyceps sinensis CO18]